MASVLKLSFFFLLLLVTMPVKAQLHPVLSSVISFEQLRANQIRRSVEWVNPNGEHEQMTFVEMTIPVGKDMERLILDFSHRNYDRNDLWLQPAMVVIHAMDLGDLKTCLEQSSFLHDRMPADWGRLPAAGKLPNGAHFFIDSDGTIYCLTPPVDTLGRVSYQKDGHRWYVRRHADANPFALGIENVTPANNDLTDLSPPQLEANARLVRWLAWFEQGKLDHLIGHHQLEDEQFLNAMLSYYRLQYPGRRNRTAGRRDIGNEKLGNILQGVNSKGYHLVAGFRH